MDKANDSKSQKNMISVLHIWSAPRSRSTAFMYSWEALGRGISPCNSNKTHVMAIDEPLYRQWLIQKGDTVTRPYTKSLVEGRPPNEKEGSKSSETWRWERELKDLDERLIDAAKTFKFEKDKEYLIVCKHMAKHFTSWDFQNELQSASITSSPSSSDIKVTFEHKHLLLLRDPVAVLSSWTCSGSVHGNNPTSDEVGILPLLSIYSAVTSSSINPNSETNKKVVVLESDDLASNPAGTLKELCEMLGFTYSDNMMTWPSGPHDCDGPWAPWWYHDVHQSSGWIIGGGEQCRGSSTSTIKSKYRTLNPSLMEALRASYPAYEFLRTKTLAYQRRRVMSSRSLNKNNNTVYEDPRNANLLCFVGAPGGRGRVVPRELAKISPWDSSVQGGDACWEGLRVYDGKILSLEKHLRRLHHSAKALGFQNVHTTDEIKDALWRVLAANQMRDGAHIRLTLSRGEKYTSSMNPKFNVYGTTLIILPEWKPVVGGVTTYNNSSGIKLITASQRRNGPQSGVDSKIHHNNMINNILPKIEANVAGVEDAVMLDMEGYVSETNATNLFMVSDRGVLITPTADYCLPGITRATVLELANELSIPTEVRRVSLAEFYCASEVFTTGTMGELTPVTHIDGRIIGWGAKLDDSSSIPIPGPVTSKLQEVYQTLPDRGEEWATAIPPFE